MITGALAHETRDTGIRKRGSTDIDSELDSKIQVQNRTCRYGAQLTFLCDILASETAP